MRTRYKITEKERIFFITSSIVKWIPVFTSTEYFEIIIESFKYCQTNKKLELYAYVILDNHFHFIGKAPELSKLIQTIKRHSAKQIIHLLKKDNKDWLLNQLSYFKKKYKTESDFQVWQEGFHPEQIFNEKMLTQKIDYIHYNPVKRGFVTHPEHWLYSSARNYILEDYSVITIDRIF